MANCVCREKTIILFCVLPFLLPTPPKRGVKRRRLSPAAVADQLYKEILVIIVLTLPCFRKRKNLAMQAGSIYRKFSSCRDSSVLLAYIVKGAHDIFILN
jgi:hypothetical protein